MQKVFTLTQLLAHVERLVLKDAIIVQHQVVDQSVDVHSQPRIEVRVVACLNDEVADEVEAVLLNQEATLALEIVTLEPGGQA